MSEQVKTKRKFNSIDAIIIAVLVLAVAAVAVKIVWDKFSYKTAEYYLTYYCEETPDYVPVKVNVGDTLTDDSGYVDLGEVVRIETGDAVSFAANQEGVFVTSAKDGYCSATIVGKVTATAFDNGIMVGGNRYTVGHTMTLRAGEGKFYLKVKDIVPASEYAG